MAGQGRPILGVDINPIEICVVEMQGSWPAVQVLQTDSTPTPPGSLEGGRIADAAVLAAALRDLLNRMRVTTRDAVMGMGDRSIITRTLDIPKAPESEVRTILQGELAHYQILHEHIETFDYVHITAPEGAPDQTPHVLVMAAEDAVVAGYCEVAERAGLHLLALEPSLLALYRAAFPQLLANKTSVCLSIGHGDIEIAIADEGRLRLYRRLDITTADLLPSRPEAAAAPGQAATSSHLTLLGEPENEEPEEEQVQSAAGELNIAAANNLVIEMQRCLNFYRRECGQEEPFDYLIVATNVPALSRVAEWIASSTGMRVVSVEHALVGREGEGPGGSVRAVAAVGLAMFEAPGLPASVPRLNLSVQRRHEALVTAARKRFTAGLAAGVAAALVLCVITMRIGAGANRLDDNVADLTQDLKAEKQVQQRKVGEAQSRQALLKSLGGTGMPIPDIVDSIASAVDPHAGLLELGVHQTGAVDLSGEATNEKVIINTLEGLKKCPYLTSASLDSFDSSLSNQSQQKVYRFQMSAQLAGVAPSVQTAAVVH